MTTRSRRLLAVLFAAGIALAGCGDDDGDDITPATEDSTTDDSMMDDEKMDDEKMDDEKMDDEKMDDEKMEETTTTAP